MKRIVLTGGGSAGHVTPHLALLPKLQEAGWEVHYIGTHHGIERELVAGEVDYHGISAGKLRRYFDWQNFTDPLRVVKGIGQSLLLLGRIKPRVIFSKGGFVSLPVSVAGKLLGIPVILHESDYTPGLANKLALPFAQKVCVTFPETAKFFPRQKVIVTGNPVRDQLLTGDKEKALQALGFVSTRPVLLVIGGSLGSVVINQTLRDSLASLTKDFQIIHVCGKGNVDSQLEEANYRQFAYVKEELADFFALADLVVSRAGANAIFELLALRKPNLLIPLSKQASRGDQILNAKSFAANGFSQVLEEEELTRGTLVEKIRYTYQHRDEFVQAMEKSRLGDATKRILDVITSY